MERGDFKDKLQFSLEQIESSDLDFKLSGGFVINAPMGSLVALRAYLEELFKEDLHYVTMSTRFLYVVQWNDLSIQKQDQIGAPRRGG